MRIDIYTADECSHKCQIMTQIYFINSIEHKFLKLYKYLNAVHYKFYGKITQPYKTFKNNKKINYFCLVLHVPDV